MDQARLIPNERNLDKGIEHLRIHESFPNLRHSREGGDAPGGGDLRADVIGTAEADEDLSGGAGGAGELVCNLLARDQVGHAFDRGALDEGVARGEGHLEGAPRLCAHDALLELGHRREVAQGHRRLKLLQLPLAVVNQLDERYNHCLGP